MEFQDYYATLGVAKTATDKEIRSAFRKLARQHHPDVNPNDKQAEERFKKVSEAYEVLSDPDKRKKYDEVGSQWKEYEQWSRARESAGESSGTGDWSQFSRGGPQGQKYGYRAASEDDLRDMFGEGGRFSDFFENIFGGGFGAERAGSSRPYSGQNVEAMVSVSLAEAYQGAKRLVTLPIGDSGKRIEVSIPPGVEDGTRIRVAGQGAPGVRGGPNGDLYLVVEVQPDARFERVGNELRTKASAPLSTLILGGEATVGLPNGKRLALRVPAGTNDGKSFRLRGQGMPNLSSKGAKGDLVVELHVSLPERPTARQRELLEELARIEQDAAVGVGAA